LAIHSAVGCAVTPKPQDLPPAMAHDQQTIEHSRNEIVGTTKSAARQSGWKWSVNLDEKRPAGL
jgi:hypothetical protein